LVAHYHHNIAQLFRIELPRDDGNKKDERPTPFRVLGTFNQTKEKSHDKALELLA
jgi:hypothetical protein